MFAVVLLVGFPAASRNLTAAALVGAYLLVQGAWAAGVVFDYGMMFMVDITVVAFICCKTINACPKEDFTSIWHQLRCCWTYHTPWDRAILAVFAFGVWPAYVANIGEFARWWILWVLAVTQFLLAGAESFLIWRRAKASCSDPGTPSSGTLRVALAGFGSSG